MGRRISYTGPSASGNGDPDPSNTIWHHPNDETNPLSK